MKRNNVFFDESLKLFVEVVLSVFNAEFLTKNLFFRDGSGRLTFVLKENIKDSEIDKLRSLVEKKLSPYVESGFSVCSPQDLYDDELESLHLDEKTERECVIAGQKLSFHYFERRLIGSDWQRYFSEYVGPARIVFASVKGGVGRSTALCVVASSLARMGRRVLTIDLDLEAPGLGNMLLTEDTLPRFGLLDYFVENNLNNTDSDFIVDMVGASWLSYGKGRIDVIPAIGNSSLSNPENVLAKISRAYLPKSDSNGNDYSFMDNLRDLLNKIDTKRYDAILIDARAGLHETTASALVGLGAEVFCFGVDQPQTFSGYELLFASIKNNSYAMTSHDKWVNKLNFVHAKSSADEKKKIIFNEKMVGIISKYLLINKNVVPSEIDLDELKDSFEVEWNNDVSDDEIMEMVEGNSEVSLANQNIIHILNDERYNEFNPFADQDSLNESVYNNTFEAIIRRVSIIVEESLSKNYELS